MEFATQMESSDSLELLEPSPKRYAVGASAVPAAEVPPQQLLLLRATPQVVAALHAAGQAVDLVHLIQAAAHRTNKRKRVADTRDLPSGVERAPDPLNEDVNSSRDLTVDELHAWVLEELASTDVTHAFSHIRDWHLETQLCQDWQQAKDMLVQYNTYKSTSRSHETWQQRARLVLWFCRFTELWSGAQQRPQGTLKGYIGQLFETNPNALKRATLETWQRMANKCQQQHALLYCVLQRRLKWNVHHGPVIQQVVRRLALTAGPRPPGAEVQQDVAAAAIAPALDVSEEALLHFAELSVEQQQQHAQRDALLHAIKFRPLRPTLAGPIETMLPPLRQAPILPMGPCQLPTLQLPCVLQCQVSIQGSNVTLTAILWWIDPISAGRRQLFIVQVIDVSLYQVALAAHLVMDDKPLELWCSSLDAPMQALTNKPLKAGQALQRWRIRDAAGSADGGGQLHGLTLAQVFAGSNDQCCRNHPLLVAVQHTSPAATSKLSPLPPSQPWYPRDYMASLCAPWDRDGFFFAETVLERLVDMPTLCKLRGKACGRFGSSGPIWYLSGGQALESNPEMARTMHQVLLPAVMEAMQQRRLLCFAKDPVLGPASLPHLLKSSLDIYTLAQWVDPSLWSSRSHRTGEEATIEQWQIQWGACTHRPELRGASMGATPWFTTTVDRSCQGVTIRMPWCLHQLGHSLCCRLGYSRCPTLGVRTEQHADAEAGLTVRLDHQAQVLKPKVSCRSSSILDPVPLVPYSVLAFPSPEQHLSTVRAQQKEVRD